jgi:hypothetical protein
LKLFTPVFTAIPQHTRLQMILKICTDNCDRHNLLEQLNEKKLLPIIEDVATYTAYLECFDSKVGIPWRHLREKEDAVLVLLEVYKPTSTEPTETKTSETLEHRHGFIQREDPKTIWNWQRQESSTIPLKDIQDPVIIRTPKNEFPSGYTKGGILYNVKIEDQPDENYIIEWPFGGIQNGIVTTSSSGQYEIAFNRQGHYRVRVKPLAPLKKD